MFGGSEATSLSVVILPAVVFLSSSSSEKIFFCLLKTCFLASRAFSNLAIPSFLFFKDLRAASKAALSSIYLFFKVEPVGLPDFFWGYRLFLKQNYLQYLFGSCQDLFLNLYSSRSRFLSTWFFKPT